MGRQSARQGSDHSVSGGGCSVAELSDFEHERLLRLWLAAVANGAEDDDAVRAARELLACNQHGRWSGNHLPLRGAPTYRAVLARERLAYIVSFFTRSSYLSTDPFFIYRCNCR